MRGYKAKKEITVTHKPKHASLSDFCSWPLELGKVGIDDAEMLETSPILAPPTLS